MRYSLAGFLRFAVLVLPTIVTAVSYPKHHKVHSDRDLDVLLDTPVYDLTLYKDRGDRKGQVYMLRVDLNKCSDIPNGYGVGGLLIPVGVMCRVYSEAGCKIKDNDLKNTHTIDSAGVMPQWAEQWPYLSVQCTSFMAHTEDSKW